MGNWKQEPQSLLPTAEPTREDVLFFAGFYEGEGSACKHGKNSIVVQVPQKDPEVIMRARSLWGGSIRQPFGRDIWVWVMSGDRARKFLIDVYPFVSARRKEQIEGAGGLTLTGKSSASVGGITKERRAARSSMTEVQRHTETCANWAKNNPEKRREIDQRYAAANREKINARHREYRRRNNQKVSAQNELQSERSLLVN